MIHRIDLQPKVSSLVVLTGLLLSAACSRATGPKNLSPATYAATRKAVAAIELANQHRDGNAAQFQADLQSASQAAEDVFAQMGNQSADAYAVSQVRTCVEQLKLYRSNMDSTESDSRPIQEQLKGLKGAQIKDSSDLVARNTQDLDNCVVAAKAYL